MNKFTFSIHTSQDKLISSLIKSFLMKQKVYWHDYCAAILSHPIDGTPWELIVENSVYTALCEGKAPLGVECIISYQVHKEGDNARFIAVAKLYNPLRKDGSLRKDHHDL